MLTDSNMIDHDTTQTHHLLNIDASQLPQGLRGIITIPGDKSISHRALMLGSLAEGETTIRGLLLGEDPRSTAACFSSMGAEISELNSELVTVKGIGLGNLKEPLDVLNAGNSGTTLRLMLGILASHPRSLFYGYRRSLFAIAPYVSCRQSFASNGSKYLGSGKWSKSAASDFRTKS